MLATRATRATCRLATLLACALAAITAIAQGTYPVKPIRYIAPFPSGGTSDVLSRLLAAKMTEGLGQTVIVENRPGASGNIGHEIAAKAPADGYTIIMSNNGIYAINPYLFKKLPYDPDKDFQPISLVAGQLHVIFSDMVPAMPHIKSGRLRALAVTSATRSAVLPDLPTMAEAGAGGFTADTWWAVVVPRGTPPEIVNRLNAELGRVVKLPEVQERYMSLGVATAHSTPERIHELAKIERPAIAKVLKTAGIEPE